MASQGGPQGPPQGQQPSPEQIALIRQKIQEEAAKLGITPQEFEQRIRAQAMAQQQAQQQAAAQGGHVHGPNCNHDHSHDGHSHGEEPQRQQVPINPGPPNPQALALANWLRTQDLKSRTALLRGERKDMFKGEQSNRHYSCLLPPFVIQCTLLWKHRLTSLPKVKRALRAIQSPEYTKAQSKSKTLPPFDKDDPNSAENIFKLLPLNLLALRVSKADPNAGHEGHGHAPPAKTKRVKGLWNVEIEQQQEVKEDLHYVWLYQGTQIKMKLYAFGALAAVFAVVLFPLWPMKLRLGVWYLSMGMLGLIGLFFAMSIFRLILFVITLFAVPPGLWLYPNLFEDVGFFDSFKPLWGWQEVR
jgi:translocation protein SEC62